ncbi:tyrosine phosphatase [Coprinopsis sp. MPI-PUGE-AT-0042]|nr:tyrosine phosphatase [Coprinopsis sp. MPI-PUGE-AT-0042]
MTSLNDAYLEMPFMNRLLDSSARVNKRRTHRYTRSVGSPPMSLFANGFLAPSRKSRRDSSQTITPSTYNISTEVDISTDLEASFASNVSLNSPPRRHMQLPDSDAMDISPMPTNRIATLQPPKSSRPRALTTSGGSRLFGSDISNNSPSLLPSPSFPTKKQSSSTLNKGTTSKKNLARGGLPLEWMSMMNTAPKEPEQVPEVPTQPSSPVDDAMDVDTSYHGSSPVVASMHPVDFSPVVLRPAGQELFFETLSPRRSFESPSAPSRNRRSLSPEPHRRLNHIRDMSDLDSSPMVHSSPSESKLERIVSRGGSKPSLQGLGAAPSDFGKRARRPVLSEMIHPVSDFGVALSAHPDMGAGPSRNNNNALFGRQDSSPLKPPPPVRRAFSALLPPSIYTQPDADDADPESSFDVSADMSSPAQAYAKRQSVKTIRRCDGTEDFRPLTGVVSSMGMGNTPGVRDSPSSKFMAPGLPGFGDNEAHGKILPCHRVTEDGLMRISVRTVDELLDGRFDDKINDYHIIDCRFDYEYAGGHIRGAVNINTTNAVEDLLLGQSLTKPRPSVSGDSTRKTVLIFHCEFSAKRAPTFAKHLRAKDRAMNNHVYPKIHYPEVYILEGGYCNYYKTSGRNCEPKAYVTMDDPNHALSRREDMDQFRKAKFGRHKSYTYGDGAAGSMKNAALLAQPPKAIKRNTAPAPSTLFSAAGNAARTRRSGLSTLAEHDHSSSSPAVPAGLNFTGGGGILASRLGGGEETDGDESCEADLGDSPCPPPNKVVAKGVTLGVARSGLMGKPLKSLKRQLVRSETYGPSSRLNFD